MTLLAAIAFLATAPTVQPAPATAPDVKPLRGPLKMKVSQIKEYNKGLDKNHPAFIRCQSHAVTGSLAMRTKICRTNEDWARVEIEANDAARQMLGGVLRGSTNGAPPVGDVRPGVPGG